MQNKADMIENNTNKAIQAIDEKNISQLENIKEIMNKMKEDFEILRVSLYIDSLTKVYNRKWIDDNIVNDDLFKLEGSLVFIDLNDFKQINDIQGHIIGDKVLFTLSTILKKELDKDNFNFNIVRYGGDEFIIFFKETNLISIKRELDKIKHKIETTKLKSSKSTFNISFSYGLTYFKENESFKNVIEIADKKMYQNKKKR